MSAAPGGFHELHTALSAEWPAPFVDCAFLLHRILTREPEAAPPRQAALLAPLALEKYALRGQFQPPRVPRAEVLVSHFPNGERYAGLLAPVVRELEQRGRRVAVALPPRAAALRKHYPTAQTFPLASLATPEAYGQARAAYFRLTPSIRAFATRYALDRAQRAALSIALQAYAWQRELARSALALTGARLVLGIHFMLDAGIRGAIRQPAVGGVRPRTLLIQHGLFVRDWPTHDFHGCDRVLLWADTGLAELNGFPAPLPLATVTGNPKLEWLLEGRNSGARPNAGDGRKKVVVLGTNGEASRDGQALRMAASALPETASMSVTFRPHPAEPRENYLTLIREGLLQPRQLDTGSDAYVALRSAHLVVGTQSTLLMEAVSLGVPAVQLLPQSFEVDWAQRGLPSASNVRELAALTARLLTNEQARQRALVAARPLAESLFGRVVGAAGRIADAAERELGEVAEA